MAPNDVSSRAASNDPAPPAAMPNKKPLSPAAARALAEAAARRAERAGATADQPKEIKGRGGLEPTRYGDWEVNGTASDF